MVGAHTNTFPAINASLGYNLCLAVAHANCLGWAMLNAIGTSNAFVTV